MDTTLIMPIIVVGFGLFAGAMFVYRKMTAGEPFSLEKFLPTMGYSALAALFLYVTIGAIPGLDAIATQIELIAPGGAPSITVIIAMLLAIYNAFTKTTTAATIAAAVRPAAAAPVPAAPLTGASAAAGVIAPAKPDPIKYLGFTVLPAYLEGVSPYPAKFKIICSLLVTDYVVDFQDGSPVAAGKLYREGEYMVQTFEHLYNYVKDGKYSGHTFFPTIQITGSDGVGGQVTNVFNTAEKGRCLSITVAA
jgi:hypothetical protein